MEDIPWSEPLTNAKLEYIMGFEEGHVISYNVKQITKPGQNFGSTLLGFQLQLKSGKKLDLVGKFMPPTALQRRIFASSKTFRKEASVYHPINSEFIKLQVERNVSSEDISDPLPAYFGSQINSTGDDSMDADENAVIFLQNLVQDGYHLANRIAGLNMEHCKVVVISLARFQATAVALRVLKPETFKATVARECTYHGFTEEETIMLRGFIDHLATFPEIDCYLEKVKFSMDKSINNTLQNIFSERVEPYASFAHNDFWLNNMMFSYKGPNTNSPSDVKFFDFQTASYSSPVRDLIFFLYTSTDLEVTERDFNNLMSLYHDTFVNWLKKLGCDTGNFTESEFQKEVKRVAASELIHILLMLNVICAEENEIIDMKVLEEKSLPPFCRGQIFQKKVLRTIQDFIKRGWL